MQNESRLELGKEGYPARDVCAENVQRMADCSGLGEGTGEVFAKDVGLKDGLDEVGFLLRELLKEDNLEQLNHGDVTMRDSDASPRRST